MPNAITRWIGRFFGLHGRTPDQDVTYFELMNLSDRQLEDIGLTRGMIESVVVQGPKALEGLQQDSAIARLGLVANRDRYGRRAA